MNPLCIAVLDRDTLADRPFDFDFPHTLSSYGSTEAHQTAERIQGADIIITNKVVISAEHIAANPHPITFLAKSRTFFLLASMRSCSSCEPTTSFCHWRRPVPAGMR